jgi:hypothetical protein
MSDEWVLIEAHEPTPDEAREMEARRYPPDLTLPSVRYTRRVRVESEPDSDA